jgi:hypothetical protein
MQSEIDRELRPQLGPGEKLLWSGQPRRGLRLRATDALLIPFSLMWCGFAVFWELSVIKEGAPFWFRLWGIPFVLMGLYLIAGRFFVDAWQRGRTYYGLTSERILLVSAGFQREVKSLPLRNLPEVTLRERGDRSGTISFGPASATHGWLAEAPWPGMGKYLPPRFDMVENARLVYGQIQAAQRALLPIGA